MKIILQFFFLIIGTLCVLTSIPHAQPISKSGGGKNFVFNYEAGNPLVYFMNISMKTDLDTKSGTKNITTKMALDMRVRFTLTPAANLKDSVTTIRYEPSEIECDVEISDHNGHLIIFMRGTEVKGTKDGAVIIDTAQDIGMSLAKQFKNSMLPLYLSGQMDLDARGNIKQIRGDLPFVEFWTDSTTSQAGFFGIVFPERLIAISDTWKESIFLKKFGDIKLDGKGLRCDEIFTRLPDMVLQDKHIATFSVAAPCNIKNYNGFIDRMGKSVRLNISNLERRIAGTIKFDQERGFLIDSMSKGDINGSINISDEDQIATMEIRMKVAWSIRSQTAGK